VSSQSRHAASIRSSERTVESRTRQIESFLRHLAKAETRNRIIESIVQGLIDGRYTDNNPLPQTDVTAPGEVYDTALRATYQTSGFDLQRVVDNAASFELLVRIAWLVDSEVVPPSLIPSDEVVKAARQLHDDAGTGVKLIGT
jgi:type II secretory pathway component GspD/PulD (secretin)